VTLDRAAIASLTGILDRETARRCLTHEELATLAVTHLTALGYRRDVLRHHVPPRPRETEQLTGEVEA
jgi:hypothetical protein